ncbi:MAG: ABC transporter permease [Deltaproteobacteria bacterium]|nr:ABC transporter permease [Deltaproteobacteria bacterium]
MLRHYLTVAFRNLAANKRYAAINIGGLTVGLAACLLILLYVQDERSYERWVPNAERIGVVETTFRVPGGEVLAFAGSPGPLKPALDREFSSELERTVRVYHDDQPVRIGDRTIRGALSYVDPGFFQLFDLPMVAGEREGVLANNASMIVSATTARTWFGDAPAIGSTVTIDGKTPFTIIGVFADLPVETHLELDAIALLDPARYHDQPWVLDRWTAGNVMTYALFRSPEAMADVTPRLPAFVDRNVSFDMPSLTEAPSTLMQLDVMPLLDIHLHADKPGYEHTGSMAAVIAFAGIALLILIIACINFVNLATARAMKRAREVAMRKVVGATRGQLVRQHLGEAIVTALIALVFAVAVVEVVLGGFNAFLHKSLRLDLTGDPTLLAEMLGLVLVVGVIGGLYPAVYLSRFRPGTVLKANQSSTQGSSRLRTGLVVFQFAISIALMICTATIYCQTIYARQLDLGFQRGDRMTLGALGDLPSGETIATLKREILALPGVRGASLSTDTPPLQSDNHTLLFTSAAGDDGRLLIETLRVDPDFFDVYGVPPVAGRLFSMDHPDDFTPVADMHGPDLHQGIVINRAFAAKLGYARPDDAVGKVLWDLTDADNPTVRTRTTIVGVVPDLYLRSARAEMTPILYYVSPPGRRFGRLTVRAEPGRMADVARGVEAIWARLVPDVPIRTGFVDEAIAKQYDADEQRGQIFAAFSVLAILIACLGLFGLAAFSAERRTKEIGMRKVLGASVLDIVRLLVWQFSRPVLIANLIAWPVGFYIMSTWLAGFRHAIDLTSPVLLIGIFGGAALIALAIAWLTTAGHAYRVARASPIRALRTE